MRKILAIPDNILLLKESFRTVMSRHPFAIEAIVILPEHLHCIWTLPDGDNNYPTRWRLIKSVFSRQCGIECRGVPSPSREAKK